jgi:hypothetical protein
LETFVSIPKEQPNACESDDPVWLAWQIKVAVIAIQRELAASEDSGDAGPEGIPLPSEGLKLWRILLAQSRARESGVAIYTAAIDFRQWAVKELEKLSRPKPSFDEQNLTLSLGKRPIRSFRQKTVGLTDTLRIVKAFQEKGWPDRIKSPRGISRLDQIVRNLNSKLEEIEFFQLSRGAEIGWRYKHS